MSTQTMKTVFINEPGNVDQLIFKEDAPLPQVTEGSVLVKNHVAGVNYLDIYQRNGLYPTQLPYTLGHEGAGVVAEVGSGVTNLKVGDRVTYVGTSTYAEYTNLPADSVEKLSDEITFEEGAAIGLQGLTAWTMVRDGYKVQKGDVVLVYAAAGGVGLLLCQMSRYLGATVIGVVGSNEKAELARANGADHTIVHSQEDILERVNEITNGLGCHAVFDSIGKDTFETSLACTRRLGTLVSFGSASGKVPPISITVLSAKNIRLLRPALYHYLTTKEESHKWWSELLDLVKNKVVKLNIHKVYDLKDVKQAHLDLESRNTTGKLLIRL